MKCWQTKVESTRKRPKSLPEDGVFFGCFGILHKRAYLQTSFFIDEVMKIHKTSRFYFNPGLALSTLYALTKMHYVQTANTLYYDRKNYIITQIYVQTYILFYTSHTGIQIYSIALQQLRQYGSFMLGCIQPLASVKTLFVTGNQPAVCDHKECTEFC